MASANEKMSDLQTTNQHLIEEYKNELISVILVLFRRMEKLVQKEIRGFYDEDRPLIRDKNILLKKIKDIQKSELNKIKNRTMLEVEKYLGSEANNYKNQLDQVLEEVSDLLVVKNADQETLKKRFNRSKITFDNGIAQSITILWDTFFSSVQTKLNQNIESAYSLDKSTKDFIADTNNSYNIEENNLNAVIAVLIQQAYSMAIDSTNRENDFISGYSWNAILDNRTSSICIDLDGRYWLYGKPELSTLPYEIYAPAHYRCRSTNPPLIKSYTELGISQTELTVVQEEILDNTRDSADTYFKWFERQPASIKKSILGPVRYNAYKNGEISIDRFYKNGRKLTLKELQNEQVKISEEYLRYVK